MKSPADVAGRAPAQPLITRDMIVRDVIARWPQTMAVFGHHHVDFCCGGSHSIEETAAARGRRDLEALLADLNRVVA
jgi:regulator of cell morphogenesis and NO signaling